LFGIDRRSRHRPKVELVSVKLVDKENKAQFTVSTWLFIRLLGLTYACAFLSYWVQIDGLIGSEGVLPAKDLMRYLHANRAADGWFSFPTLSWWWVSDFALNAQCLLGAAISLLVILGFAPNLCLFTLWILYLSLVVVGREFTSFQWDNLLLESGLMAVFLFSPIWRHRLRDGVRPSSWMLCLYGWLLFRIMFSSGMGKFITSGDPSWDQLTALNVHFETQPLPTWLGYYWHQLPKSFHAVSCIVLMVLQVILPFGLFAPRVIRRWTVLGIIAFQLLIAATGNYGFFNLNTIVIAILLIDDGLWAKLLKRDLLSAAPSPDFKIWRFVVAVFVLVYFVSSSVVMLRTTRVAALQSAAAQNALSFISPFRSVNGYGLFVVMTTERNEIILQGSDDGEAWKNYEFKHKPGERSRYPEFMAPHMPRLDWQMWFAALGKVRGNRWFVAFAERLLQGKKPVLDLLRHNPFPDKPPRYIRALRYKYRFTNLKDKTERGHWWRRVENGQYMTKQSLR
jgi:hypothetical protein